MKAKFYCIIFFLTSYLFSSDNSNIQTYTVANIPVQVVERIESEPDENGIQNDTFVQAEGNEVQEILQMLESDENIQNDLRGADLATVEFDRQTNELYIMINYPNGEASLEVRHI